MREDARKKGYHHGNLAQSLLDAVDEIAGQFGLEAVTLNGPANPREFADLEVTKEVLRPLSETSGGGLYTLESAAQMPDIRMVGRRADASGNAWLGLRERGAYAVRSSTSLPLLPGLLAVGLILIALLAAWRREGR